MKILKKIILVHILLFTAFIQAQELNCKIQINSEQIQGTNKSVFNTLEKSMSEFVNNRKWTEMTYANTEKIECTMNIIVKKVEDDIFTTEIQVQSRRPVFNTAYYTTLFNYKDNSYSFNYKEFDQLEWNENVITSNLTAVLAYYSYLIIGFDMDSYSRLGGTPYFQKAEGIVTAAQGSNLGGWDVSIKDPHNRYALTNNLLDEAFKKYRNYFYEYHRLGLDEMAINAGNGRAKIAAGLPTLRDAYRARPSSLVITTFLDAKNDELINIFSKGSAKEKTEAVEILSDVNPSLISRYEQILKNQ